MVCCGVKFILSAEFACYTEQITGCKLWGSNPGMRHILFSAKNVQTGSDRHPSSCPMSTEYFPPRVKRSERDASHSAPPVVQVRLVQEQYFTLITLHVFSTPLKLFKFILNIGQPRGLVVRASGY